MVMEIGILILLTVFATLGVTAGILLKNAFMAGMFCLLAFAPITWLVVHLKTRNKAPPDA